MKETVGVGIIGTGFARRVQIPGFLACENALVVSVASGGIENARSTAEEFDIGHYTADWKETAAHAEVDIVCITTPPAYHKEMALFAIEHGKHVLCEKPMAMNVAEAEDLTQEAFLQLHRKIATFRGDSAFSTWLHRLSINVVLMHLRKKGLPLMSLDEAMEPSYDDGPGRSFGAPDLSLTGSIDRLALERAVAALPAGYRLIFVLHDVEGFEHNEIAAMLDCSVGNSKSQLHKARLKLRDALRISLRKGGRR